MSDTAHTRILVAKSDASVIAEAFGTPDEESNDCDGHTMFYYSAPTDIGSILSETINRGVPFEGEHGATIEHPEHAFCAAQGRYLEWPLLYNNLCVSLREDAQGRITVDRANLRKAREYWALRQQALQCIRQRQQGKEVP